MKPKFFSTLVAILLGILAFLFSAAFSVLSSAAPASTGLLTMRVSGMNNSKGVVRVVLYNSEKTFLSEFGFAAADSAFAQANGTVAVTLHNLSFGTYAAAFYHDENQNGVIDQNMFRVPTESYAFSNSVRAKWNMPNFKEVAFKFNQTGTHLDVILRKWSEQ